MIKESIKTYLNVDCLDHATNKELKELKELQEKIAVIESNLIKRKLNKRKEMIK